MEHWKDINGFEGLYAISSLGRVKALRKTIYYDDGRVQTYKEYILKNSLMKIGYVSITLTKNKIAKSMYLHRLLADAFIDNPLGLSQVNHKDGNRSNNALSNLEYTSNRENTSHGYLRSFNKLPIGVQKTKYNRFKSVVWHNGVPKYLGTFDTPGEAHAEYKNFLENNGLKNKYALCQ